LINYNKLLTISNEHGYGGFQTRLQEPTDNKLSWITSKLFVQILILINQYFKKYRKRGLLIEN